MRIDAASFPVRIASVLAELSANTQTDFIQSATKRGLKFFTAPFVRMAQLARRTDGKAPLGLYKSGSIYLLSDRDRFNGYRFFERCVLHEVGHWLGLRHTSDQKSIMNTNLPVADLSASDWKNFQARLGK